MLRGKGAGASRGVQDSGDDVTALSFARGIPENGSDPGVHGEGRAGDDSRGRPEAWTGGDTACSGKRPVIGAGFGADSVNPAGPCLSTPVAGAAGLAAWNMRSLLAPGLSEDS